MRRFGFRVRVREWGFGIGGRVNENARYRIWFGLTTTMDEWMDAASFLTLSPTCPPHLILRDFFSILFLSITIINRHVEKIMHFN